MNTQPQALTNQTLIDAVYQAATALGIDRFHLLRRTGAWSALFDRNAGYAGPPVEQFSALNFFERMAVAGKLAGLTAGRRPQGGATTTFLNLRSGPGTNHSVLITLPPQTLFRVREEVGEWLQIAALDRIGFVHRDFVEVTDQLGPLGFLMARPALFDVETTPPDPFRLEPELAGSNSGAQDLVRTWNRFGGLLAVLANELRLDPELVTAVLSVESGGQAFGPDGRMAIRFETHIFHHYWGTANPERFARHFRFNPDRIWLDHAWRPGPSEPWRAFHGDPAAEWQAFTFAAGLDGMASDTAAKQSISMGAPQIMGLNFASLGYESVQAMFDAFSASEVSQIVGFFDFVQSKSGVRALQRGDFHAFAEVYNGPGQAARYAGLIGEQMDLLRKMRAGEALPVSREVAPLPEPDQGTAPWPSAPAPTPAPTPEDVAENMALIGETLRTLHRSVRMAVWAYAALVTVSVTAFVVALFATFITNNTGQAVAFALVSIAALALFVFSRPWKNQAETVALLSELTEDLRREE